MAEPLTARGSFEVQMQPAPAEPASPGVGRMLLDKQFAGDLAGRSQGQMLAVRTAVEGSAGYVAIEVVTATLAGRSGSFALQHSGFMNRGVPSLTVTVIPDSGTGELAGIEGQMRIIMAEGKHSYEFDYGFAPATSE